MSVISTLSAERRVVVVGDGDFPGAEHPEARRVIDAVSGARALVVAPAGPVAGERWVVDLSARAEQARRRLDDWWSALAPHVCTVDVAVGDASATLAAADAQHAFRADTVIATRTTTPAESSPRWWAPALARLTDVRPRRSAQAVGFS
jgi:hypothetical protein